MQPNKRYPRIFIRSKNELAKHLASKKAGQVETLNLINDVILNYDKYWKDSKHSQPLKGKYVRNARGTPLGVLLNKINKLVLAPHDKMLPDFIFGGVAGRNHKKAGEHLLGAKRRRVLLKMDVRSFFEGIGGERIFYLFKNKFLCSPKASRLLANICSVPLGPKDNPSSRRSIGRGFATSSRLAVWSNLDIFIKLDWFVRKALKGRDPKISIYVDDIGITASRVSKKEMERISLAVSELLNSDHNQKLPLNPDKTKIISHEEGMEILGLRLNRNNLSIGPKTRKKLDKSKNVLKSKLSPNDRAAARAKHGALVRYKKSIEGANTLQIKKLS
jgi:hypothetical protein